VIDVDHLTYTYPGDPIPAIEDLTLHIDEGEFVLVIGASGEGKSTLLRSLNGLVPHFTGGSLRGRVAVAGHDPVSEGPQVLSRIVGFVFQDPEAQFVMDRAEDEVAFGLENAALPRHEIRQRVDEVLELLELVALRDRTLDTLSGGERQRVAIAAALAFRPRVLVLDEPTSQLDPQSAADVLQALVRLNQELGLTIVLAEHRMERILPYADRVLYLPQRDADGVLGPVLDGPPREVLRQVALAPPVVRVGRTLGWDPLPLTIEEGLACAARTPGEPDERPPDCALSKGKPARLAIDDLHFAYDGAKVLRGVDLTVGRGELVALMGPNGSGKTTLLKCIVGLLSPERGTIAADGRSLAGRETADICRSVGYLPQDPDALLFAPTVSDELRVTLRNQGMLGHPPIEPAQLLRRLGLEAWAAHYPRDLSVGQRQRVALGAIAVTRPGLLLLDEPTRGLDYALKQGLVDLLREWQTEGAGILLVTHDVELVAQAADRVVLLSDGEVVADGTPLALAGSPGFAPQVAQLFPGRGWLTVEDALGGLGPGRPH
jgi:energy-coupling factor transport system ATP-binding protein